ncbi:hypothetical protein ASD21_01475 [Caulobacter sp. Root1455]|uniref:hypothetical protein n=1 Tax=unclassified Caulobacter TaxID=2648921 RepID=UPI000701AD47|nr:MULTISPECIES: hypothetical protein [unclassified Caulobacter]KQY35705.1 hypothetical protein ASD38_03875 [Caulobacter sp. Root487D2Y]KQZ06330.1 hypothetical protein ASD21_01475 [Caulobacter sp. Root1455]
MVQVLLHNSTLTPAPAAYGAAVEKALAAAGATLGADGEVGLAGQTVLVVTVDPEDDIAVIDLERFDDAVLDLVFDLAEATASFVVMGDGAVCATPATGQPPPAWSMGIQSSGTAERADFRDWLAGDIETQLAAEAYQATVAVALAKARAEREAKPAKPIFQRLTDALFGKSI